MRAEIAIVGGGVMGTAIAWHAARRSDPIDSPVVLLEKTALAAGSSGRSGAILRQFYGDDALIEMARDSLRVYANFEATTGRAIGFQKLGVVTLAGPEAPDSSALLRRNVAKMQAHGVDVQMLDAQALRKLVPAFALSDETIGAHEPDGGGVDPVRTVEAFGALAREHGAVTRLGVRVTDLRIANGRVLGVETDAGFVEARQVVVASGPWTRALLSRAGVELPLRVVVPEQHFVEQPRLGRTLRQERLEDSLLERFGIESQSLPLPAHPVVLDLERGFYTRCEGHALRTRVGRLDYAHDREIVDADLLDEHVDDAFKTWARAALVRRLPMYERERDVGAQVGWYTLTPDAQAVIGRWPTIEGLVIVSGFSGHGFKLAPSVGEGVAQMLWNERVTAFDAKFFAPDRFTHGATVKAGAFGL